MKVKQGAFNENHDFEQNSNWTMRLDITDWWEVTKKMYPWLHRIVNNPQLRYVVSHS